MIPERVILCLRGGVGGVDVFATNFVQELLRRGVDARVLLTTKSRSFLPDHLPIDGLPVHSEDAWPVRWKKMIRYLEDHAPCTFIPNYEYNYSCVSPKLSQRIMIVGIVHSDEGIYYEDVLRVGRYWNGIVAVSKTVAEHIRAMNHPFSRPVQVIPYGVEVPPEIPKRLRSPDAQLRIVFVGRLVTLQKRVLDLPSIFHRLAAETNHFEITIIGDGPERDELLNRCEPLARNGKLRYLGVLANREVLKNLETQDVFILSSEFEGMPISVLEAMGRGCVPVVSSVRSGIPELVRDGYNGFIVGVGDVDAFANRLALLQRDLDLRQEMSLHAYETIRDRFDVKLMADNYLSFFQRLQQEVDRGMYHRPEGPVVPPPELRLSWKQYLPGPVRTTGIHARNFLRRFRKL